MDSSTKLQQQIDNTLEDTKLLLIEGIINRQGTYDKGTFNHVYDFHRSIVNMMMKREKNFKLQMDELKWRLEGLEK